VDATSDIPEHDYTVPFDKAAVRREGKDVTVLNWLLMAHLSLVAAEQLSTLGINAEVVDLRSLVPIDYETIERSLKKTGPVSFE
jgi:pyruvate dehydrogenase E1 component beta subunit